MAKTNLDGARSIGLAILGIVTVVAIVGLVLLFSGGKATTGKVAGVEQPYANVLGGKEINQFHCPESCSIRGMLEPLKCTVNANRVGEPATLELNECMGKLESGQVCDCAPIRRVWS